MRQAGTSSGTHLTILNLFEKIFAYIFDLLKEQSFKQPESHACSAGRTFDQVPKECRVTYPVEFNIWLRMMLCEAAKKAGFEKVAGVSEPLAAAHHIGFANTRAQFASQAIMIIDSGGGSTVSLQGLLNASPPSTDLLDRMRQRSTLVRRKSNLFVPLKVHSRRRLEGQKPC